VKGYGQYCPIARGAEIYAERWTPIIIRNLYSGCTRFGELLDGAPGLSRTLLSRRLQQLQRRRIVENRAGTYHLTPSGVELAEVGNALGVWGTRWLEIAPEHLDVHLALRTVCRLVDADRLPDRRVVVRFDLTDGSRPNRYWLVLSRADREVCVTPPGFDDDLVVTTDATWLIDWHTGAVSLDAAVRSGHFTIDGPRELVRAYGSWGGISPFAGVPKPEGPPPS
jgi:DNA-binding HxlR family transcriptional regulator